MNPHPIKLNVVGGGGGGSDPMSCNTYNHPIKILTIANAANGYWDCIENEYQNHPGESWMVDVKRYTCTNCPTTPPTTPIWVLDDNFWTYGPPPVAWAPGVLKWSSGTYPDTLQFERGTTSGTLNPGRPYGDAGGYVKYDLYESGNHSVFVGTIAFWCDTDTCITSILGTNPYYSSTVLTKWLPDITP